MNPCPVSSGSTERTQMTTITESIQCALEDLQNLPTPVSSWLVETGFDATDDPAVWMWAMIERKDVDAKTLAAEEHGSRPGSRQDERSMGICPYSRSMEIRRSVMSLHKDLLAQARFLATKEQRRPSQASLRGGISASYTVAQCGFPECHAPNQQGRPVLAWRRCAAVVREGSVRVDSPTVLECAPCRVRTGRYARPGRGPREWRAARFA